MLVLSESDVARFWSYVARGEPDACWEWTGGRSPDGYGYIFIQRKYRIASRVSHQIHTGEYPGKLHVRHKCDHPPCVNPHHLILGTHGDNNRDSLDRGLRRTKLTLESVAEIRRLYATGLHEKGELAEKFGVGRTIIFNIIKNKKWYNPNYDPASCEASGKKTSRKLTPEDVAEVRLLHATGQYSQTEIARRFHVSDGTISLILSGQIHHPDKDRGWLDRGSWHAGIEDPTPRPEDVERFYKYVAVRGPDECWHWTGAESNGYGHFRFAGKHIQATRMAYLIHTGDWGRGLDACHTCDNSICVNPKHIFMGTESENMRDAITKERSARVLTWDLVREIRRRYRECGEKQRPLAKEFGIAQSLVSFIVRNEIWVEISGTIPEEEFEAIRKTNGARSLTWDLVREIRRLHATGGQTQSSLAKRFGLSGGTISMVVRGRVWVEPTS